MAPATRMLRAAVRGYQLLIRPVLPASCRYYPSCSQYALEALARHGALRGSWLALARILRCHPWAEGGVDPVPDAPHAHGPGCPEPAPSARPSGT
ncbi:MAG TPA: membrane protein insertion efficiency factor YidD [Alphaproteobacteria bacterium]|nr:membrane protein insertion efficiency factor YidD [Alphaproteobacteria bacterium]